MVDLAVKTLLHDKPRFAITVAGVAFAVALVLIQVGLFLGLLENASITIDKLNADIWVTSRNTPNVDFAQPFPDTSIHRVRAVTGVTQADNLIVWYMPLLLKNGARESVLVYALANADRWGFPWNIAARDGFSRRSTGYVLMDESSSRRFGAIRVGESWEILGRRFSVSGLTREARSFTTTPIAFMAYRDAQSLDPQYLSGQTTYIIARISNRADAQAVKDEIARRLPFNDVYRSDEWSARSRAYWIESTGIGLSMTLTILLGCLVGVTVVAQTLYAATMEHSQEYGTVKAIGGHNADIYRLIAKQAIVSAILGYGTGVCVTFAVMSVVSWLDLQMVLSATIFIAVFLGAVSLCLGAALFSFRQVSRLDPAIVFRR